MSHLSYRIKLTGAELSNITAIIDRSVLPVVHQTVKAIAQATAAEWQSAVHSAKLWSGEKDAYAGSIKWEMTSDLSAMVSTDYKWAEEIESGRPQRDLKKMLDTSMKVRLTKGGKRFLVIPMRHNTTGNGALAQPMPAGVAAMAKAMQATTITSMGRRETGEQVTLSPTYGMSNARGPANFLSSIKHQKAATVAKRNYAWGDKLTKSQLKGAGMTPQEVKKFAGMVKMDTSTPGGSTSSSYMTFRVMMEGGKGWLVPAKPGLYLARTVAEKMQPKAQEALKAAIAATMKKAI